MPELPEVETIKRELEKEIIGKKINKAVIKVDKLTNVSKKEFEERVKGKKIKNIYRRAKLIVFELSGDLNLLIHLKMTGQLIYTNKNKMKKGGHPYPIVIDPKSLPNKYSYIIFYFSGGGMLFFNDQRKFGYIKLFNDKELEREFEKFNFGLEIFDRSFTLSQFTELLKKRGNSAVKPLLMDQSFIAGVGNIYAQEACFYAKINPKKKAGSLTDKEIKSLYEGLKKVMKKSIDKQGTSSETYVDIYGRKGGFLKFLKIYGRAGEKCYSCGSVIKQEKIGGRGTAFCPKCQK